MKNIFLCVALSIGVASFSQDKKEQKDTCKKHHSADFYISGNGCSDTSTIKIGDSKINFLKDNIHWSGFGLGFNGLMSSFGNERLPKGYDPLNVNTQRISAVQLNLVEHGFPIYKRYVQLVTGMGFEWNNFFFTHNFTWGPGDSVKLNPNNVNYTKNKLVVDYITIPLFIQFNTSSHLKKSFHLALGFTGAFMYRSHTKQLYYDADGNEHNDKNFSNPYLSAYRVNAIARAGFGSFSFFTSYALTSLFKQGSAPAMYPFTFGMMLIGF